MFTQLDSIKNACAFIDARGSRGTGYLVTPEIVVTCDHVIDRVSDDQLVKLLFGEVEREAIVFTRDKVLDFAVLKLTKPLEGVDPLPLATNEIDRGDTWEGYGFPWIANHAGHPLRGHVQDPRGKDPSNNDAILLYSDEIAAGLGATPQGFSGAPVLVNGCVIGHLRRIIPVESSEGIRASAAMGTLYASPVRSIANRLQSKGIVYRSELVGREAASSKRHELLERYRSHLQRVVGRVKLFNNDYVLEKVFVELSVLEQYEAPSGAQWVGIADADLRRRKDVFFEKSAGLKEKIGKRIVKPTELLRRDERAFIVGAPGCGKTTLLRYLVWKTLADEQRLAVLLELKNVTEEALSQAGDNLVELLLDKAICDPLHFDDNERLIFKEIFHVHLTDGRLAIFLDGLDEVSGTTHFERLCRSITALELSAHNGSIVVSSRPYAYRELGNLRSMEISPLTITQIKQFLTHYFGDSPWTRELYSAVQRRRELLELARVPFLLSVIAQVFEPDQNVTGERLSLYHLIVKRLVVQIDKDRGLERFRVEDHDGTRKRAFLALLAFERLLVDNVEGTADRVIFDDKTLAEKALRFCRDEGLTDYRLFITDVKHSPLLREVSSDAYAFSHLTIQEYLAAEQLKAATNRDEIFIRAYFDPVLVEMEVLPMMLGLLSNQDEYYRTIEQLPDSVSLANLRLRVRGLSYVRKLGPQHLSKLTSEIIALLFFKPNEAVAYTDFVYRSLSAAREVFLAPILTRISSLLKHGHQDLRALAAQALGVIGHERSASLLIKSLRDKDDISQKAIEALKAIGSETVIEELLGLLQDEDEKIRETAMFAISDIGGDIAFERLLKLVCFSEHRDDARISQTFHEATRRLEGSAKGNQLLVSLEQLIEQEGGTLAMWLSAVLTVFHVEGKRGLAELLVLAQSTSDKSVKDLLVDLFRRLYPDEAAKKLLAVLTGDLWLAREQAGEALTKMSDSAIVPGLIEIIKTHDDWKEDRAAAVLGKIGKHGDARAIEALRPLLASQDETIRRTAVRLLVAMNARQETKRLLHISQTDPSELVRRLAAGTLNWLSVNELLQMMGDAFQRHDSLLRSSIIAAIARHEDDRVVFELCRVLREDPNETVRATAAEGLGRLKARTALPELLSALNTESGPCRRAVIKALGEIGSRRAFESLVAILGEEPDSLFDSIQMEAVSALGKLDDDRVIPALLNAFEGEDQLRSRIVSVLEDLKGEAATDMLTQVLLSERADSEAAARALADIGGANAASALLSALTVRHNPELLRKVGEAINEIGDAAVAHGLFLNLSSPQVPVRRMAVEHIGYYSRSEDVLQALSVISSDDEVAELHSSARASLRQLISLPGQVPPTGLAVNSSTEFGDSEEALRAPCTLVNALSDPKAAAEIEQEVLAQIASAANHDEAHSNVALMFAEQGKFEEAEAEFRAWGSCSFSNSSEYHHTLGWFCDSQGRSDEAKAAYIEAIRLNPQGCGSRNNLGNIYVQEYAYEEAEQQFREAIRVAPTFALAHRNLAELLVKQGRNTEAEEEFRAAINHDPENFDNLHSLGMLLTDLGKYDEAVETYLKELELDPANAAAFNNLGLVYSRQQKTEDAERCYRQSISYDPELLHPHRNLNHLLRENSRLQEAEAEVRKWFHHRGLSDLHADLAESLAGQGRSEEAIEVYREWLECTPESMDAYDPLINLLGELGRASEAESVGRDWARRSPDSWGAQNTLWELLINQGKTSEARTEHWNWVKSGESRIWYVTGFADKLAERGFVKDAENVLMESIQHDPSDFSRRSSLAKFFAAHELTQNAEEVYREWLVDHPESGQGHLGLGILLAETWRMAEAEQELMLCLECFGEDGDLAPFEFIYSVGPTYMKLEKYVEGATILTAAIRLMPDQIEAYSHRANLNWYGGLLHEALLDFNHILPMQTDDCQTLNARGQVLAELGEYEAAIVDLKKAIALEGDSRSIFSVRAYALNGLGLALGCKGEVDEAMRLFEESISISPENGWVYLNRGIINARLANTVEAEKDLLLSLEKTDPRLPQRKREQAQDLLRRVCVDHNENSTCENIDEKPE